ncbi:hypothetical protein BU16DRAFT_554269 [Lophium mytilinum]|uniref:Rhodopsin domain-containing protein n=1 Tax=Lophium mytilinum TaxID=390894 RepID=A0A6A6RCU0_9PEZI|nr:hypothetical protein BU16DRAFT_554269 [Lophium mytilinum]
MSLYGGQGPMTNGVVWTQCSLASIVVALRMYTRRVILHNTGLDDYLMVIASILFIIYSALVTVATASGLGQPLSHILDQPSYAKAIQYVIIAQTVFLAAIAVASSAVAVFLLRLVLSRWQRTLLWSCIISHCIFSATSILAVFLQCSPVDGIWDRRITNAKCWKGAHALNYLGSAWSPVIDFVLASLPWVVVWSLQMPRRDKLTVATALSLIAVGGVSGIIRTVQLYYVYRSPDWPYVRGAYTLLAIWSSTELFSSMFFASIPILRPLYMAVVHGTYEDAVGSSSQRSRGYPLQDYGNRSATNKSISGGPTTMHTAARFQADNTSEESILGASDDISVEEGIKQDRGGLGGIKVTEEFSRTVTYSETRL